MRALFRAGTDSLPGGVFCDPAVHVRCRFPGKHHALFMDVFIVSDRANDLPPSRYRQHPARIRPCSPYRTTLLVARTGIPAFVSFSFGHCADSRAGHPCLS